MKRWVVVAALSVVAAAAGCANDGRELRPPSEAALNTTTTSTTSTSVPGAVISPGASVGAPRLLSAAFEDGGPIPFNHTCEGADVSPPLLWSGTPVGTVELAVTVTDRDAGGFVHWVIAKLNPELTTLGAAEVPAGAVQANNDFDRPGYAGPCPPSGVHSYEFTLYALAAPSGITAGEKGSDAVAKLKAATSLAQVHLVGTYQRS